jgi:hypothetical protein
MLATVADRSASCGGRLLGKTVLRLATLYPGSGQMNGEEMNNHHCQSVHGETQAFTIQECDVDISLDLSAQ